MSFPTQTNKYLALGKPGTKASANPVYYVPGQNVAGENGVKAGTFAWATAGAEDSEIYNPTTYSNSGTGKPVGLVEALTLQDYINDINSDATMLIYGGHGVNIACSGDYFVTVTATATVGQSVYANLTNGTAGTASAGKTWSGYVETEWKVSQGTDAAGVIIISKSC